ncbi:response regulator transcription factor [Iamia majanohamensis]|uniref:Response regulator transcription factor n=1 Tax=Iamia majanohamensis TaxID=467976 RepID=A0AAE9Y9E7_9ACTN|nr:response regulator transcription factor [Iamia majanohamensis]WCO68206.1 response regulator transcription factor [Iamia majanohamensis]
MSTANGHGDAVRVVVIDDYEIVVQGTAALLAPHADRVRIVERNDHGTPLEHTDVALLECFALTGFEDRVREVREHPLVDRVALYTWGNDPTQIEASLAAGASGFLSKGLTGDALARSLVKINDGERVVATHELGRGATQADERAEAGKRWPGRDFGLTERESEVLALITQGLSTAAIAEALYLSSNSIKTHTRKLYRKINVGSRTQAALWGIDHGFRPDREAGSGFG